MSEYQRVLSAAVDDLIQHGFESSEQLDYWVAKLRAAANNYLPSDEELIGQIKTSLEKYLNRAVSQTHVKKTHKGIPLYSVQQIKPQLRDELAKRIRVSAELIKLNRKEAIEKTLQRFSGIASSIPEGGSNALGKREFSTDVAKSLRQMPYVERRLHIDQGHKLMANVDAIVAEHTDAIAMQWSSRWRSPGYDYREDHKERDGRVYAIRTGWAYQQGFINSGAGFVDAITRPAEEVFCRCSGIYLHALREMPPEMLTDKGRAELERVRVVN